MPTLALLASHPLGVRCLDRLHDHPDIEVTAVVTYAADAETWWDGSVRDRALELGYEPLSRDEIDQLTETPVDYLLSVYYPDILDESLLDHPDELPLNLHQAELPRYRGSNVFTHSILNAREDDYWRHGTTLHVMEPSVDSGAIIDRQFAEIRETDTARSLYERVCEASIDLFEAWLPAIADRTVAEHQTPQSAFDGPRYFYAKDSLDGRKEIDPERLADGDTELYDRIRALDFPPHEPAWTTVAGERLYLTRDGYRRYRQ
ncbi:hypothetical protein BRC71_02735 [Halobacteriales archaeon QH_7_65_31]|nr:MAG: hypothetical protein BRC71_02735 [Halobacteriales archaeon QH_7_65_31]